MAVNTLIKNLKSVDKSKLIESSKRYNHKVTQLSVEYRADNIKSELVVAKARLTD